MLITFRKRLKYFLGIVLALLLSFQPAFAGGPPEPSIFTNSLAVILMILMVVLLIVIAILGNILVGAADVKMKKKKKQASTGVASLGILVLFLLLPAGSLLAQEATAPTVAAASNMIGGLPSATFYLMITVIFLELALIIVLLINIRLMLQVEKEKVLAATVDEIEKAKEKKASWWDKMNKFRPVSQESELDLGHEYDGIRELNNRLPPWWIYGFYLTILFAAIYLWRFHVSHQGPSSRQEYEMSVARAELKTKEYLKKKGDAVDENTVKLLVDADDLAEGKAVFMRSCASCHLESGGGSVGPNLTDDFWIHGNDLKSIFKTIRYGVNAMPQWQNSYSNKQIAQVTSYIKSLRGTNPPNAKAPQGTEMKEDAASATQDSVIKKDDKVTASLEKNK